MKRVILSLVALATAVTMAAQVRPQSNHTVSTTLGLGLEYGFEWAFAGQATVIGRVGYASKDFLLRSSLDNFQWSTTMAPMVTLEPRYYFLMNWREAHGKYTRGNSAEFFSVPTTLTLARDAKGIGELAVSPVLGVRRAFATHWFHEFTAGADLLWVHRDAARRLPDRIFILTPSIYEIQPDAPGRRARRGRLRPEGRQDHPDRGSVHRKRP